MKNGYHDVTVVSYETGVTQNGVKVLETVVRNDEGQTERVAIYFSTPENIKISLEQLKSLGWKGKGFPLDDIVGGRARICVYEEEYETRDGDIRTTQKVKFVRSERQSAVKTAMSRNAAQSWLDGLDRGPSAGPAGGRGPARDDFDDVDDFPKGF